MSLCRYDGSVVVMTLYASDRSLYSIHSVIFSQWKECNIEVM